MKNTKKDLITLIKNRLAELAKSENVTEATKLTEEMAELGDQVVELIRGSSNESGN